MEKIDPQKVKALYRAHARELLAKGLPPSIPPVEEEFYAASERLSQVAEDMARQGGATEIPQKTLDARAAVEKSRRTALDGVKFFMGVLTEEMRNEAKDAALKASISDRPALQQLYAYLVTQYLEIFPRLVEGKGSIDKWMVGLVRTQMGGLTAGFFLRKSRKEFPELPITATVPQRAQAWWEWVDYVILQVYQLKNHVRLHGEGSTDADVILLGEMREVARREAQAQLRASGRLPP